MYDGYDRNVVTDFSDGYHIDSVFTYAAKGNGRTARRKKYCCRRNSKAVNLEQFEMYSRDRRLSAREMEVAWLLYRGYTNRQIAEELYIAESTVKKHVSHVYEKMLVSSRKEWKEKVNREIKK